MTVIYVPRLIESAAQAEALPDDTVAIRPQYFACEKHCGVWRNTDAALLGNHELVGFTALVPIEAEEDFQKAGGASVYDGGMGSWPDRTRLVTPWESVYPLPAPRPVTYRNVAGLPCT